MKSIRRIGALFVVLIVGVFIGTLGWTKAILILTPLFLLWLMQWDEHKYYRDLHMQEKEHQVYRKQP